MQNDLELLHQKAAELETENKHLQKSLHQSEERFNALFHASSNPIAITTVKEGRIVDLNEANASLVGYKREELIGRSTIESGLLADPGQREIIVRKLREEGRIHNFEEELRTNTGEIRTILLSAVPITVKDESCLLCIAVDITETKKAQEDLRESQEYLNQIINSIGDPIFVKDREHNFVLANDALCAFAGKPREALLGKGSFEALPVELKETLWKQEEEVFNSGGERLTEDTINDGKGATRTLLSKKSLLVDKKGNHQIIGVLRDITEYKRLEAQLFQSQKIEAIGLLAGGVAHDFNNLLNVIIGYSDMALQDLSPDNPTRKDIEEVLKAGQRAATLTSQLLAFSRKQILQPEIINLKETVAEMGTLLRRLIGEDIELITVNQPDPWIISADPAQIQQIIMNLAVNARDAMPKGGKIIIETANVDFDEDSVRRHQAMKSGSYVMLAISDNGVGMDEATQSRIFEPFFTTKEKNKGTGLGLSTVYGIVKQSNGFIWVYSEPGKGAAFKIYFPRVEGEDSNHTAERKSEIDLRGSETVLIVEDEESVRALACRILRERNYIVFDAADGIEALRIAQEFSGDIHLVLTDVVMPGMSGRDLVSQLEAARPGIKSLFISGYTDDAIVHHGILDSGVAFLQKPFMVEGLARKVREVIDG